MRKREGSGVVVPLRRGGWFDVPRAMLADVHTVRASGLYVYAVIASHKNARGEAWPSLSRIVDVTGYNRRTVQRAIDRLAAALHIEVVRPGDGRRPTIYRLRGGLTTAPGAASEPPQGRSDNRPNDTYKNENHLNEKALRPRARRHGEPIPGYEEGRAYPGKAKTRELLSYLRGRQ